MPDASQPPKRRRRWPRYSLRSFLVVLTIGCLVLIPLLRAKLLTVDAVEKVSHWALCVGLGKVEWMYGQSRRFRTPENASMMSPNLRLPLVCGLAVLLLGSFGAGRCQALDLSGGWSGQWYSCKNGHHGPMSMSLCKIDEKQYAATFRGRFWKIIPFRYRTVMTVFSDDGKTVKMGGSQSLGRLMGTFSFTANVTETCFDAHFTSCRDWGKFEMSRCCSH